MSECSILDIPGDKPIRAQTLDTAKEIVCKGRQGEYGGPERNFSEIARLWAGYLGRPVEPHDVAAMMILMKVARIKANPAHEDSWIDIAGYAACGNEVAP